MSEKLKQHLINQSDKNSQLKLLYSQWCFDEELIPKALQNISTIFPNFSRHDASHSRQILINIERLLGETLFSLSATDTWLLLEAAFWHDIGMIVTSKDIETDTKSTEFKQYVDDIASQQGHELQSFAAEISSLPPEKRFSAAESPHEAIELYRQLLTGWYRGQHSSRSAEIVDNPMYKAGISSPRNELVPKRLFRVLGQICMLHGNNFNSILNTLPLREVGIATDDCHPRFIACLLRLGDLLDLDDNRFCPVMLRVAGAPSSDSQAHMDKHASIRHFRLDQDRIEISAVCDNYESYEVTDQWFRWLEDEFKHQMTHWNDIVPSREFGLLPTLGCLKVELSSYEILDSGERPHFDVDPQKIIELLQGANLYRDRWQSLRELLQNAVDATLIRIWLTHNSNNDFVEHAINLENPTTQKVKELFALYPIKVLLSKGDIKDGCVQWNLEIKDQGIGISKQDIGYMKSVGSSAKNIKKQHIIAEMPKWLKPSGAFGIGLQSAFMLTDKIVFESNSLLTGDKLKVEMKSPIGQQRGLIYIQRRSGFYGLESGTTLKLTIETEAIPERVTISHGLNSFTENILDGFDPILMGDMPYDAAKMVDEIIQFSQYSLLPIKLSFDEQSIDLNVNSDNQNTFYDLETGVRLSNVKFGEKKYYHSPISFRGQHIEKYHVNFPFVSLNADILCDSTQTTLTINRNDVKTTAREHIYQIIVETVCSYICKTTIDQEQIAAASAFLFMKNKQELKHELKDKWSELTLEEAGKTIKTICEDDEFKIYEEPSSRRTTDKPAPEGEICLNSGQNYVFQLLREYWHINRGYLTIDSEDQWNGKILRFSKEKKNPYSDIFLKEWLLSKTIAHVGGRYSMPIFTPFEKLSSKVNKLPWCQKITNHHNHEKHFILPFFFSKKQLRITTNGLEELCLWTVKHSDHSGVEVCEVRKLYQEFIKWIDNTLMADQDEWGKMREQ